MHGYVAHDLVDVTDDLSCLNSTGRWFVAAHFEGPILAFRFANWTQEPVTASRWHAVSDWRTHTSATKYIAQVEQTREAIARGDVYQANICRLLSAPWSEINANIAGLYVELLKHNPAPMSSMLIVEDECLKRFGLEDIQIASASPEIFLKRRGNTLISSPIKGTAALSEDFLEKDVSENVMIVDLVRNDLSRVCDVSSIEVPELLAHQLHPGLKHLVSTVTGEISDGRGWSEIFEATFPPGSVTGAPKSSALKLIAEVESPRNIYCGALGVVDADEQLADLSVAIRTFWKQDERLWFGAGAGITWGSDPEHEWEETELKARNLLKIASRDGDV
jgi:para-aminobenzoate synthetase component 1